MDKQIFDEYGGYNFPTEGKQEGLNTAVPQIEIARGEGAFLELLNQEMKELQESQKRIEEMADYIFGNAITHDTKFKEDCRSIARDLHSVGYRKNPEGAVVLTREEYDGLKLIASNYSKAVKEVEARTAEKFAEMAEQASVYFNMGKGYLYKAVYIEDINAIRDKITEGKA